MAHSLEVLDVCLSLLSLTSAAAGENFYNEGCPKSLLCGVNFNDTECQLLAGNAYRILLDGQQRDPNDCEQDGQQSLLNDCDQDGQRRLFDDGDSQLLPDGPDCPLHALEYTAPLL